MEIGHRIKRLREEAGMSQTELANAVGVSRGLVGQWESHRKKPGREVLRKLARAIMVNPTVLLDDVRVVPGNHDVDVVVGDHNELALLRRFRNLSRRQQENLLELLGVGVDLRREIEQESHPTKRKGAIV
jgi:DNA-binding XRE family transcriptional regulator